MQNKLFELMLKKKIKQKELSEKTGIHPQTLHAIQYKKTTAIDFDIIEKLCNALEIMPNDLFDYEPKKKLTDLRVS